MKKNKIIWVNGCFDILHVGHIRMLEYAKSLGDFLVVGIDSDSRVKILKGESRPINTQEDRAEVLRSIRFVDAVVTFDSEDSLRSRISECGASLIVVGEEYKDKGVIGSELAEISYFRRIEGYSSTSIIDRDI